MNDRHQSVWCRRTTGISQCGADERPASVSVVQTNDRSQSVWCRHTGLQERITSKHVFINHMLGWIRKYAESGSLSVRVFEFAYQDPQVWHVANPCSDTFLKGLYQDSSCLHQCKQYNYTWHGHSVLVRFAWFYKQLSLRKHEQICQSRPACLCYL